jgi:hypothetical protein
VARLLHQPAELRVRQQIWLVVWLAQFHTNLALEQQGFLRLELLVKFC